MDAATDDLIRKVTALLDKAESSEHPAEVEAFTAKAMELMATAHIDAAMIDARRAAEDPAVLAEVDVELGRGSYVKARLHLLAIVADAHDCRVLTSVRTDGRAAHLYGHRGDVDRTQLLYTSLLVQATRHAAAAPTPGNLSTLRFRRSFLFGFADTIASTFAAVRDETVAARAAADARVGSASAALVLAARRERVQDWVDERFGRLRSVPLPTPSEERGYRAGRQAGRNADLGRPGTTVSGARGALRSSTAC